MLSFMLCALLGHFVGRHTWVIRTIYRRDCFICRMRRYDIPDLDTATLLDAFKADHNATP